MHNYTVIMKLDSLDNRVAKYLHFPVDHGGEGTSKEEEAKAKAAAEAHVADHLADYPNAFVQEDDGDVIEVCDPACWRFDVDNRTVLDRTRRPRAMRDWRRAMAAIDLKMPRHTEDLIDIMTATQFDKLSPEVKDNHAAKKTLRGQRP